LDKYDAIVVGLGGMGSAALANAARRGLRVLGLDQFTRGHDLGASSGRSRIIRKAYFEHPAYVPLLLRAYELWREMESESGCAVLHVTGMLVAGKPESALVTGAKRSARIHGLALEKLTAQDMARRFPMFQPRPDETGVYEPDGGYLVPEAAIAGFLSIAERHDADMRFETSVTDWSQTPAGVRITTSDGSEYGAGRLALCAGPWFGNFATDLGVSITVQRNVQYWFDPVDDRFAAARCPVFFLDREGLPAHMYGFPDTGDGVKAAFHGYGETTTPETLARSVSTIEIERLCRVLEEWMPGSARTFKMAKACMYSVTPDQHFVISALPGRPNVVVAGGFSGHGFKFASVVGEIVADLLIDRATRHNIDFLSPKRF
jgi:sarcosine oxidase